MLVDPAKQAAEVHGTGAAGDFPPAGEQDEGGYAADAQLGGQALIAIGIQFGEPYPWFKAGGGLLEHRRHGTTGSAPSGPEIHQQGQIAAFQVTLQTGAVEGQGLASEQGLMAFAAMCTDAAALAKTVCRHTIDAVAVRTDNM